MELVTEEHQHPEDAQNHAREPAAVTGSRRTHTPSSTPHTGNVYARIAARPDSMNVRP